MTYNRAWVFRYVMAMLAPVWLFTFYQPYTDLPRVCWMSLTLFHSPLVLNRILDIGMTSCILETILTLTLTLTLGYVVHLLGWTGYFGWVLVLISVHLDYIMPFVCGMELILHEELMM